MTDLVRDHGFINILILMFKREYFLMCWGDMCKSCDSNNKKLEEVSGSV